MQIVFLCVFLKGKKFVGYLFIYILAFAVYLSAFGFNNPHFTILFLDDIVRIKKKLFANVCSIYNG